LSIIKPAKDKIINSKKIIPPLGTSKKTENERKINIDKKRSKTNFMNPPKSSILFYHPLVIVLIYLVIHLLLRISISETLQVDDREQLFFASELKLGYPMPQPPLYSWLSYFFFKIFGVNLTSLTFVKYILIFLTFTYLYFSAKIIFKNNLFVNLTVFSYFLMPSFAWHMHQGFTHTVLLGLSISMTFFYIIKIQYKQNLINYLFLGLSIGIGMLSKYSYFVFLILISLTVVLNKETRYKFFTNNFYLSLLTILVITLPHYYWLFDNWELIYSQAKERIIGGNNLYFFPLYFEFFKSSIGFLSPLIFVLLFKFNSIFLNHKGEKPSIEKFLDKFFLLLLILSFLVFIFFDFKEVKVRWLHPVLMLFPFWIFLKFEKNYGSTTPIFIKIFTLSAVIFSILILSIRVAQLTIAPKFGYYSRINVPIISAFESLPKEVIDEVGIIKSEDYFLGPHIVSFFSDKSVKIYNKSFNKKALKDKKNCLVMWDNDGYDDTVTKNMNNYDGKITKMVYDFEYTLFYRIEDIETCK